MSGWKVIVETERLGGGKPAVSRYAAWISDEAEAVLRVSEFAQTLDEKIYSAGQLTESELKYLGLTKPGQVLHIGTES
jgi:hypothetical protein